MEKTLNRAAPCRPETIGIRQLSAEVSLGLRSPVIIRAGEVYGSHINEKGESYEENR